jgi:hypothetical protein
MSETMATETLFVSRLRAVQPLLMPQLGEHKLGLYITAVGPLGESLPKGHDRAFLPSRFEHRSSSVVAPLIRPFWTHTRDGPFYTGLFHNECLSDLRRESCGCLARGVGWCPSIRRGRRVLSHSRPRGAVGISYDATARLTAALAGSSAPLKPKEGHMGRPTDAQNTEASR